MTFTIQANEGRAKPMPGFPASVANAVACQGGCVDSLRRRLFPPCAALKRRLCLALRFHLEEMMLMIEFVSDDCEPVYALLVNPQFLNKEDWEATVLSLVRTPTAGLLEFLPGEVHDFIP